jgi:hypothetical protein
MPVQERKDYAMLANHAIHTEVLKSLTRMLLLLFPAFLSIDKRKIFVSE